MIEVRGKYHPLDEAPYYDTHYGAWRCDIVKIEPSGDALLCCGALVHGGPRWAFGFSTGDKAPCPRCTPKATDLPGDPYLNGGGALFQGPAHTDRDLCCRYATLAEVDAAWDQWFAANDLANRAGHVRAFLGDKGDEA